MFKKIFGSFILDFVRLKIWIEELFKRRNTHIYSHVIGLSTQTFTQEEALVLKQHFGLFRRVLENKLMVVNATTFWSTPEEFHAVKGKVKMLEEIIKWGDRLEKTNILTEDLIPIRTAAKEEKKEETHPKLHF